MNVAQWIMVKYESHLVTENGWNPIMGPVLLLQWFRARFEL